MKFAMAAGGTGGHIYPALSVAQALAPHEVVFLGTRQGPEAEIVPRAGFRLQPIPARKIDRRPGPGTLLAVAVGVAGVAAAARILRAERPAVVLGTGGYAAAPTLIAAWLLGIPTAILEANVIPGRANRLLSRFARQVLVAMPATAVRFPGARTRVTGWPIRPEIAAGDGLAFRQRHGLDLRRPLLFVFGGSQGSLRLNSAVVAAIQPLTEAGIQVLHQTGKAHYERVMEEIGVVPPGYVPLAYVEEMAGALAAADLLLCRSGSSVAEVTAAGKPAILVPLPTAVGDHQTHNARALVEAGAAVLVPDAELDGPRLVREVTALLGDEERRARMAAASRSLGRPDAAARVAEALLELAGGPPDAATPRCAA